MDYPDLIICYVMRLSDRDNILNDRRKKLHSDKIKIQWSKLYINNIIILLYFRTEAFYNKSLSISYFNS